MSQLRFSIYTVLPYKDCKGEWRVHVELSPDCIKVLVVAVVRGDYSCYTGLLARSLTHPRTHSPTLTRLHQGTIKV